MLVFFRNGTSVLFSDARLYELETTGLLTVKASRGRVIAEVPIDAVAFWCYDTEDVTTYGFADRAND